MKLPEDIERMVSASLLRLRKESPFFATLALFTTFRCSELVETAATNGKDVFVNQEFLRSLPVSQVTGLLLHEVLHAALLHPTRRGQREPVLWNIAADIVVNGAIVEQGVFELPPGGVRDKELEHLSAEEIYEIMQKNTTYYSISLLDLLDEAPVDAGGRGDGKPGDGGLPNDGGSLERSQKAAIEAGWRQAMQQAMVIARTSKSQGSIPTGIQRELGAITQAQLDWRSYLWRYLVQTPTDFMGFDRRFIGRGLYLENLEGESVQVFVAVDTSGSIGEEQMGLFLSEVVGILRSYPHINCQLYYVDAEAYGPYHPDGNTEIPKPVGGGGTSFVPFFDKVKENWDCQTTGVCVYLTDGYGIFPEEGPPLSVLWVVTPGGLELKYFPFGETVRLIANR